MTDQVFEPALSHQGRGGTAIVAIPREDDYVWRVSSEKVPHLTLLFLGETDDEQNKSISEFLEHLADVSLHQFGLAVDRRGELGALSADVLFFKKNRDLKHVQQARDYLLANDVVNKAYSSIPQFDEWTPHLTLGYPEAPAKPDDRDYPGIHWITFDRIGLWTGEFLGSEYVLEDEYYDDMAMGDMSADTISRGEDAFDKALSHYGVRGMKWGVRRSRGGSSSSSSKSTIPVSDDYAQALAARKKPPSSLSNQEMRSLIDRMNLEKQYTSVMATAPKVTKGAKVKKFVSDLLVDIGRTEVSRLAKGAVSLEVEKRVGAKNPALATRIKPKKNK